MGFLYAVSGFSDPGKVDDLSKNPRVKNLIWLLGGAATVFFADWKIMSGEAIDASLRGVLVSDYAEAALGTTALVLAIFSLSIYVSMLSAARRTPALAGRAGDLVLEYITSGFRAYEARRNTLEADAGQELATADALGAVGTAVSVLLTVTALERHRPDQDLRDNIIDQGLAAIEDTVKLFGAGVADLGLQTNYMIRVTADRIAGAALLFAPGDAQGYDSFLLLRRYRSRPAEPIALPIAKSNESNRVLPGAPMAVLGGEACVLNAARLDFRADVPAATRAEIKSFFERAGYKSVLSVPLVWERRVVGVVNVESNHIDLVGKGPDIIRKIGLALAPYCVILGELVSRSEG